MNTVAEILNAKKCGDLFENDITEIKAEYRRLAKQYHPDVFKEEIAHTVITKLNLLYTEALTSIEEGTWKANNKIFITSINGKKIAFKYLSEKSFELGKFYIGNKHIIYLLNKEHKKFYDNAILQIGNLTYKNDDMKKEFSRYFPKIEDKFQTDQSQWCLVLSKTEDEFLLEDLLLQQNGKFNEKHVAWVISRLSNIACYLQYKGIVHNGISLNNCFVSPKFHSISLFGGWWYATKEKQKMIGTQKAIFDLMPLKDKYEKIANSRTDLECIKFIAKQLLNDKTLIKSKEMPIEFINWIKKGSSDDAVTEFKEWSKALDKAWGKRVFVILDVNANDIYKI